MNPDDYMEELDFDDPMHTGKLAGGRSHHIDRLSKHQCCCCGWEAINPCYFITIDGAGQVPRDINHTASVHVVNRMANALSCLKGCTHSELQKIKEAISAQWAHDNRIEPFDEEARDERARMTQTVLREIATLRRQMETGKLTQA